MLQCRTSRVLDEIKCLLPHSNARIPIRIEKRCNSLTHQPRPSRNLPAHLCCSFRAPVGRRRRPSARARLPLLGPQLTRLRVRQHGRLRRHRLQRNGHTAKRNMTPPNTRVRAVEATHIHTQQTDGYTKHDATGHAHRRAKPHTVMGQRS